MALSAGKLQYCRSQAGACYIPEHEERERAGGERADTLEANWAHPAYAFLRKERGGELDTPVTDLQHYISLARRQREGERERGKEGGELGVLLV